LLDGVGLSRELAIACAFDRQDERLHPRPMWRRCGEIVRKLASRGSAKHRNDAWCSEQFHAHYADIFA
jgi:hypothetical protein